MKQPPFIHKKFPQPINTDRGKFILYIAFKYILYLIEKAFPFVIILIFIETILELFKKLLLGFAQILGHFHIYGNILIASVGAVETLYALASYSENSARLSALGNGYLALAVNAGYLYLIA